MPFWSDFFKLWSYSRSSQVRTDFTKGITDVNAIPDLPPRKHKVILLVDDDFTGGVGAAIGEDFRKADYVITRSGKYLKSRHGDEPVVVNTPPPPKGSRYRSIDDA